LKNPHLHAIIALSKERSKKMTTATTIFFDMDGTIANLYGVENWLDYLENLNPYPYMVAEPLLRLSSLARVLNRLQRNGYRIGVISWLSKVSTNTYDELVTDAKKVWLKKHLPSVKFDEINIVKYGTPKEQFAHTSADILFDDEDKNRTNWTGAAFDVDNIMAILKGI
jgi:hypothetical protein